MTGEGGRREAGPWDGKGRAGEEKRGEERGDRTVITASSHTPLFAVAVARYISERSRKEGRKEGRAPIN